MIQLRPVSEKDSAFIEMVYRSTREEELALTNWAEQQKQAFIIMQSMAQLAEYKKSYPGAVYKVIVYKKQDVGRLITWETNNTIRIVDISLLPAVRGKGIGSFIVNELITKAAALQKNISLHVLPNNPALKLYQRLGFEVISKTASHLYMETKPVQD